MMRRAKRDWWKYAVRIGLLLMFVILVVAMFFVSRCLDCIADKLASGWWKFGKIAKHEFLSSFMEVMIALNVASLFDGVRKYFDAKQSRFVSDRVREICKRKKGPVKDSVAKEVEKAAKPILKYTRKNSRWIGKTSKFIGVTMSMALAVLLITNVPNEIRSYVFMSAVPVAMLYVVGGLNYELCKLRLRYACLHVAVNEDPIDDESVIEAIDGASGPKEVK